jgi:rhomboid protease GluP
MSELETAAVASPDQVPENLVEVGEYRTHAEGFNHGLVVLAMQRPYWLIPAENSFRLYVESEIADAAREQLAHFDRESVGWPPRPIRDDSVPREFEFIAPLAWAVIVLAIFRAQMEWPEMAMRGALDTQAIFGQGEWWRLATALFLHADAGHVISNAVSGIFVFGAVTTTLGRLRGWVLLFLASVVANLAVAGIKATEDYRSLGASTAIFAGLGLLTGRSLRRAAHSGHPHRWRSIFVPFAAGVTLLGLYGAGGLDIDVGAHVAGFMTGIVFGYAGGIASAIGV